VEPPLDARERALCCINAALTRKAHNLVVMKVAEISSFADYFLVCSGASDRQVRALCSAIEESLKKAGMVPLGIEGEKHGRWVLMDYDDIVIHVFLEPLREFYDIERLWVDAPRISIPDDASLVEDLPGGW